MEIRRFTILVAVLALALAACGGAAESGSPTTAPGAETTAAAPPTTAPGSTGGTAATPTTTQPGDGAPSTTSGRPIAPDFTLELGDGGSYTLSEGAKPVYLVFWAEW